ncbi:hypothetical protein O1611_g1516 [Lasiodiplodia mahajangana]|uniref:Uncharacterized protein n=1 Tax=Lasiodiplodia mahajangana TaxID=1108764 RepID=A0ACC2JXQ8_9PEZI|nr:hypothetical protein O1611_g1516 [Lasiodiplodia mahajangana]
MWKLVAYVLRPGCLRSAQDLGVCETAIGQLHEFGLVPGDANRYNFLITGEGAKLRGFKHLWENASSELMSKELENARAELADESGRGRGFICHGDID